MKFLKRAIVKSMHRAGYDLVRVGPLRLFGLTRLPVRTVIDIGANRGQFARTALQAFPQARVYCFEPLPAPFQALAAWAHEVGEGSVTTINVALGERDEEMEMLVSSHHDDSSSMLPPARPGGVTAGDAPWAAMPVRQTTLDRAVRDVPLQMTPEILVKVDVNGYEDRVILGGAQTLAIAKACILEVCLDTLFEGQATFAGLFTLMRDLGFDYRGNLHQSCAPDGHIVYIDAIFMR